MPDWAIVIGINNYWKPKWRLQGAVSDALRMRNWLLDPKGGGIHTKRNIALLLSPSEASEVPPEVTKYAAATKASIIEEIDLLLKRSGGKGDRLYFFYSGHGLTSRVNLRDEEALVPSDFNDLHTDRALGLWSIIERFQATQFSEQFFIIDACRDIPWDREFKIGGWPGPVARDPTLPAVEQFVLYATSPRMQAAQITEPGNERAAFTSALIDGLKGTGTAKVWDKKSERYIVKLDSLFSYVKTRLAEKKNSLTDDKNRKLFQPPRIGGEHTTNPILVKLPVDAFSKEDLHVYLEPSECVPMAKVRVRGEDDLLEKTVEIEQPRDVPVHLKLWPQSYTVYALVDQYNSIPRRDCIDLYETVESRIRFEPQRSSL